MAQENAFLDEFSYCGMLPAIFQIYLGVFDLSKCCSSVKFDCLLGFLQSYMYTADVHLGLGPEAEGHGSGALDCRMHCRAHHLQFIDDRLNSSDSSHE